MILSRQIRELRLQEQLIANNQILAVPLRQRLADSRLNVVPALICGVDTAEPHPKGEFGQNLRAVFFPGGAVKKLGNSRAFNIGHVPNYPTLAGSATIFL